MNATLLLIVLILASVVVLVTGHIAALIALANWLGKDTIIVIVLFLIFMAID